jgi:ribose-phosphate pyrophosphokinase
MESNRGRLLIASCTSGDALASRVTRRYEQLLHENQSESGVIQIRKLDRQFKDSETTIRLESHVGGYDVFLFQSLFDPANGTSVDQNYMAFIIAARAFREHGAEHITGVLPYLAYSRQDKPTKFMREPTTAQLMAELSIVAGIDRLVTWHPHSDQIHGFYGRTPINVLSPLSFFIREFQEFRGREDTIVVGPDEGASNLVTHLCRALDLNGAVGSKHRPRPEQAAIAEVIGDFHGKRTALIVDDIIGSAGTLYALIERLEKEADLENIYVAASHNLCVANAVERLKELHDRYRMRGVVVTDSVPPRAEVEALPFVTTRSLADDLCRTINRIHYNQSVSEVFYKPRD